MYNDLLLMLVIHQVVHTGLLVTFLLYINTTFQRLLDTNVLQNKVSKLIRVKLPTLEHK